MWNYVYFFIHVWAKERNEYTGIEQYLADQLDNNEISFFPVLRSSILEESEKREKNKTDLKAPMDAFEQIGDELFNFGGDIYDAMNDVGGAVGAVGNALTKFF
jgi:hypothetical protein